MKLARDHYKHWKFYIHGKMGYVMPAKRDRKKNPICTSTDELFLKDGKFDNHWVGHSVMKSVYAE